MIKKLLIVAFGAMTVSLAAASEGAIYSLHSVAMMSPPEAAARPAVRVEATVVDYNSDRGWIYVQDGKDATYVITAPYQSILAGDRVLIEGYAGPSFRPVIHATSVKVLPEPRRMPAPISATFASLISGSLDCRYVRVRGVIRAADMSPYRGETDMRVDLATPGGDIEIIVDDPPANLDLHDLLDAEVEARGAVGGHYDGKMEIIGIQVHMQSLSGLRVLRRPAANPWQTPLASIGQALHSYRGEVRSSRMRVSGTLTYYRPGQIAVLQNGSSAIRVETHYGAPLRVGDTVEATGFPGVAQNQIELTHGELRPSGRAIPIAPRPLHWKDVLDGSHTSEIVQIEGRLIGHVRENAQDVFEFRTGDRIFTATLFHAPGEEADSVSANPEIETGSLVRVRGVLFSSNGDLDHPGSLEIRMRTPSDLTLVSFPSWYTRTHLLYLILIAIILLLGSFVWGWMLKRKVALQTRIIAENIKAEAALERRRSRVLEAINGSRSLTEILQEITRLVSKELGQVPCWCQLFDGASASTCTRTASTGERYSMEVVGRSGAVFGHLFVELAAGTPASKKINEALGVGAGLAALAVSTRRAYSDLRRHAEYDRLTDCFNRFSLEKQMDSLLANSRECSDGAFGVVYIDLDKFKQINDHYGHRGGDLYLQVACKRMKEQLRSQDFFARLGGDEFVVLIPGASTDEEMEDIASRLAGVFEAPFLIEGYGAIQGGASVGVALFPCDGQTREQLLNAADTRMYQSKYSKRQEGPPSAPPSGDGHRADQEDEGLIALAS